MLTSWSGCDPVWHMSQDSTYAKAAAPVHRMHSYSKKSLKYLRGPACQHHLAARLR